MDFRTSDYVDVQNSSVSGFDLVFYLNFHHISVLFFLFILTIAATDLFDCVIFILLKLVLEKSYKKFIS